jgi:hypothetical protein
MKCSQVQTPVEALAKRCEMPRGVLLKVECMVATRPTGLEIAEDGVDPLDRWKPGSQRQLRFLTWFIAMIATSGCSMKITLWGDRLTTMSSADDHC